MNGGGVKIYVMLMLESLPHEKCRSTHATKRSEALLLGGCFHRCVFKMVLMLLLLL
jgi:hypothetical protein